MKDLKKQLAVIGAGFLFAFLYAAATLRRADSDVPERFFDEHGVMTPDAQTKLATDETLQKPSEQDRKQAEADYEYLTQMVASSPKNAPRFAVLCDACNTAAARRARVLGLGDQLRRLAEARKLPRPILDEWKALQRPVTLPDTEKFWGGTYGEIPSQNYFEGYYISTRHNVYSARDPAVAVELIMKDLKEKFTMNDPISLADAKRLRAIRADIVKVTAWVEQQNVRLDQFVQMLRDGGDDLAVLVPVTGYGDNISYGAINFVDTFGRDPSKIIKKTVQGQDVPYRHPTDKTGLFPRTEDKPEKLFWEDRTRG